MIIDEIIRRLEAAYPDALCSLDSVSYTHLGAARDHPVSRRPERGMDGIFHESCHGRPVCGSGASRVCLPAGGEMHVPCETVHLVADEAKLRFCGTALGFFRGRCV